MCLSAGLLSLRDVTILLPFYFVPCLFAKSNIFSKGIAASRKKSHRAVFCLLCTCSIETGGGIAVIAIFHGNISLLLKGKTSFSLSQSPVLVQNVCQMGHTKFVIL